MICTIEQENVELKNRIKELEEAIQALKEQIREMLVDLKKK